MVDLFFNKTLSGNNISMIFRIVTLLRLLQFVWPNLIFKSCEVSHTIYFCFCNVYFCINVALDVLHRSDTNHQRVNEDFWNFDMATARPRDELQKIYTTCAPVFSCRRFHRLIIIVWQINNLIGAEMLINPSPLLQICVTAGIIVVHRIAYDD